MVDEVCPVCETNLLVSDAEILDGVCSVCVNADESLGGEQDFDEMLYRLIDTDEDY